jgi:hypothetical protein
MTKAKRRSARKHAAKASQAVERAMHRLKRGALRSGGSGKKVTSRKQAVAIGLSEARHEGAKVPPPTARSVGKTEKPSVRSRKR